MHQITETYDPLNDCLVNSTPDQPPEPACSNCSLFTQTKWHRSVFQGQTGYCWRVNQNRRLNDTCPDHQFVDEF